MMLHQEKCPHCDKKNIYYDDSLKANKQIEDDVTKLLDELQI
jgi:transcription initiation factor IIE alpha subunit